MWLWGHPCHLLVDVGSVLIRAGLLEGCMFFLTLPLLTQVGLAFWPCLWSGSIWGPETLSPLITEAVETIFLPPMAALWGTVFSPTSAGSCNLSLFHPDLIQHLTLLELHVNFFHGGVQYFSTYFGIWGCHKDWFSLYQFKPSPTALGNWWGVHTWGIMGFWWIQRSWHGSLPLDETSLGQTARSVQLGSRDGWLWIFFLMVIWLISLLIS